MSKTINARRCRQFDNTRQDNYWFTSDDMPFYTQKDAEGHARDLKDKTVENLTKAEAEAWEAEQRERERERQGYRSCGSA